MLDAPGVGGARQEVAVELQGRCQDLTPQKRTGILVPGTFKHANYTSPEKQQTAERTKYRVPQAPSYRVRFASPQDEDHETGPNAVSPTCIVIVLRTHRERERQKRDGVVSFACPA